MTNFEIVDVLKNIRNVICDLEKLPGGSCKPYALLERVVISLCIDLDNIIKEMEKRELGV